MGGKINGNLWLTTLAFLAASLTIAGAAFPEPATPQRLTNAGGAQEAANWMMVLRTYYSHRQSPLDYINAGNVDGMHLAFVMPLGGNGTPAFCTGAFDGTPPVNDARIRESDDGFCGLQTLAEKYPRSGIGGDFNRSTQHMH
jgi:alcohol dehydrogenase (cytochrome c)